jgi:hypothetical protein
MAKHILNLHSTFLTFLLLAFGQLVIPLLVSYWLTPQAPMHKFVMAAGKSTVYYPHHEGGQAVFYANS